MLLLVVVFQICKHDVSKEEKKFVYLIFFISGGNGRNCLINSSKRIGYPGPSIKNVNKTVVSVYLKNELQQKKIVNVRDFI